MADKSSEHSDHSEHIEKSESLTDAVEVTPSNKALETRAKILTRLLTIEDKKLIANLIDQKKKIILHPDDLKELIASMRDVTPDDVLISTRETIVSERCKARILPFKVITELNVKGGKLTTEEKALITNDWSISLDTVYDEPFKKLETGV